jgi:uncharacterized membrane protein YgcG
VLNNISSPLFRVELQTTAALLDLLDAFEEENFKHGAEYAGVMRDVLNMVIEEGIIASNAPDAGDQLTALRSRRVALQNPNFTPFAAETIAQIAAKRRTSSTFQGNTSHKGNAKHRRSGGGGNGGGGGGSGNAGGAGTTGTSGKPKKRLFVKNDAAAGAAAGTTGS